MNISLLDSEFSGMDFAFKILGYGINGLIFLLLYLAYKLLSNEQKQKKPRENLLKSIYIFLSFSTILCIFGFYLEYSKNGPLNSNTDCVEFNGYTRNDIKLYKKEIDNLKTPNDTSEEYNENFKKLEDIVLEYYRNPDNLREINSATLYDKKGEAFPFIIDLKIDSQVGKDLNVKVLDSLCKIPQKLKDVLKIKYVKTDFRLLSTFEIKLG